MLTLRGRFAIAALFLPATVLGQTGGAPDFSEKSQFELGAFTSPTVRIVSDPAGAVERATASTKGAELTMRTEDFGGLVLRYETGTMPGAASQIASGRLEYLDGRVLLGTRSFALSLGYLVRSFALDGKDRRMGLPRAGLETGYFFSGAGLAVNLSGSYVRSPQAAKADSLIADGIEGSTSVTYAPAHFPAFVKLGYRRETFNLARDKFTTIVRREEVSGVSLMVGLQYGLSVR